MFLHILFALLCFSTGYLLFSFNLLFNILFKQPEYYNNELIFFIIIFISSYFPLGVKLILESKDENLSIFIQSKLMLVITLLFWPFVFLLFIIKDFYYKLLNKFKL